MNTYEVMVIFKPILDVETVDNVVGQFQKVAVEANGGEIVEADRIGRKRLVYELKRFKDGFLALFQLKLPAEGVVAFRRACQLNEEILRMTMVRVPNPQLRTEELARRAAARTERDERGDRGDRGGDRGGFRGPRNFDRDRGDRGPRNFDREPRREQPAAAGE